MHSLGNYHGTGESVPFVNGTFEWGAVIATFLSVSSIVPRHCAHLTYFLHQKFRKMNAVLVTPQLITPTLLRSGSACPLTAPQTSALPGGGGGGGGGGRRPHPVRGGAAVPRRLSPLSTRHPPHCRVGPLATARAAPLPRHHSIPEGLGGSRGEAQGPKPPCAPLSLFKPLPLLLFQSPVFNILRSPSEHWRTGRGQHKYLQGLLRGLSVDHRDAGAHAFPHSPPEGTG